MSQAPAQEPDDAAPASEVPLAVPKPARRTPADAKAAPPAPAPGSTAVSEPATVEPRPASSRESSMVGTAQRPARRARPLVAPGRAARTTPPAGPPAVPTTAAVRPPAAVSPSAGGLAAGTRPRPASTRRRSRSAALLDDVCRTAAAAPGGEPTARADEATAPVRVAAAVRVAAPQAAGSEGTPATASPRRRASRAATPRRSPAPFPSALAKLAERHGSGVCEDDAWDRWVSSSDLDSLEQLSELDRGPGRAERAEENLQRAARRLRGGPRRLAGILARTSPRADQGAPGEGSATRPASLPEPGCLPELAYRSEPGDRPELGDPDGADGSGSRRPTRTLVGVTVAGSGLALGLVLALGPGGGSHQPPGGTAQPAAVSPAVGSAPADGGASALYRSVTP